MKKPNRKIKFILILIISVILFSNSNINQNFSKILEKNESSNPKSALYSGTIDIQHIVFEHQRGSELIKIKVRINDLDIEDIYDGSSVYAIMIFIPSDAVRTVNTAWSSNATYTGLTLSNMEYNRIADGEYGQVFVGYDYVYMTHWRDTGNEPNSYVGNITSSKYIYYSTSGTGTSDSDIEAFIMEWYLCPLISLNSDYYNLNNIRIEAYTNMTKSWIEYNPHEIVLDHPDYKYRIYDIETDEIIYEDSSFAKFKTYRTITIDSIKLTNNYEEPVIFILDTTEIQVPAFSSSLSLYEDYDSYTVEDLYGNILDSGTSVSSGDNLIYTPLYEDGVFLTYVDQNGLTLNFDNFQTLIDFGDGYIPVLHQLFDAPRNSTINMSISDLESNLLLNDSLFIEPGLNYKNITIQAIYLENNADEQITAFLFNRSSEPTDFYTYDYLDSDYESYENSSFIENFDSNSFQDTTISFENNSINCPSLSISFENQIKIGENNTFQIYPIKTFNDISIVKIWNNITLVNETLTESLGYYTKNFNSSYSHYYSVEIYIEDTSGFYNIMKIDNIFVLKNQIRINIANLQNKYVQYTALNVSANMYNFDGSEFSGSNNFTLKYPNGTIIKEQTSNLEYTFGYTCDYYTLIVEYFGDLDNLACSVETIFEVITPPGISYQQIFFDEDPIFNMTISPYSTEYHNMTSFSDEILYVMYFDIYFNELFSEVFNFSTTNTLEYTPELLKQCRLVLTDQLSNLLNFENYHVYIDNVSVLSNLFYRTVDSNLNITIYDLFGNLLYEGNYNVEREDNFIDISLDQFSLKILNQLREATILNITNIINPLDHIVSENIAIDEIISLNVKEGDYSIYYIDDSGIAHTISLTIDESKLLILNTTYHEVYFSFFDLSGLGLDSDTARFYINSERRDIGKNWIQGDTCLIKVSDYFNETLYLKSISIVDLTEFNIYLPVYTMLIHNNYSVSMEMSIQRIGNSIEFKQIISPQDGFPIRLLSNVEYGIHFYYINGTLGESKTVLLTEDFQDISFGTFEKTYTLSDLTTSGVSSSNFILAIALLSLCVISMVYQINKIGELDLVNVKKKKSNKRSFSGVGSNPMKTLRQKR